MPQILSEIPPSNDGTLLLVGTTVVGSRGVYVSFWDGEDFEMLVLSFINAIKNWRFSVRSVGFSININLVLISLLLVGFNGGFNEEELLIRLGIHFVTPFWNFEA